MMKFVLCVWMTLEGSMKNNQIIEIATSLNNKMGMTEHYWDMSIRLLDHFPNECQENILRAAN